MTPYLVSLTTFTLAFVWLTAATGKIFSLEEFKHNLQTSFGVPEVLVWSLTVVIIFAETTLGVLLFTGSTAIVQFALWVSLLMLGGFSILIASSLNKGKRCNCFGQTSEPLDKFDLLRNVLLLSLCLLPLAAGFPSALTDRQVVISAGLAFLLSQSLVNIKLLALVLKNPKVRSA